MRFGSARYSVPTELVGATMEVAAAEREVIVYHPGEKEVARHPLVAPGEASIADAHYGGADRRPSRAVRPRSEAERSFLGLGEVAERFLRAAAAAGTTRLVSELAEIVALEAAWGSEALVAALGRALAFRRFRSADARSILAAGEEIATPVPPGQPLQVALPMVPRRPLAAYALEGGR